MAGRSGRSLSLSPHYLQLSQLLYLHAEVQIHQVNINEYKFESAKAAKRQKMTDHYNVKLSCL